MGKITLELLDENNLDAVSRIDRADISTSWVDTVDSIMETTQYGLNHGCIGHTWAIKYDDAYIGVILLGEAIPWETDPPEMRYTPFYRLMGFVIDRQFRGQGIGGTVLEQVIAEIYGEYGVRPIALGVHRDNHAAARFYERHGFRRTSYFEGDDMYFLRYPPGFVRREYSFGVAAYTEDAGERYWLLVRESGGHTGLPKGHIEPGETEQACALREAYEETGVRAVIVPGFRKTISYAKGDSAVKYATYFLAVYDAQPLKPLPGEAGAAMSLPFADAIKEITHEETRAVLRMAQAHLERENA